MDKKVIQKQIDCKEACCVALESMVEDYRAEIATAKADLAEAEKPELRSGGFGIDEDGSFFLWENTYLWTKEYEPGNNKCLSRSLNKTGNDSELREWAAQITGNIFDYLTELAKPLRVFKLDETFISGCLEGTLITLKDCDEYSRLSLAKVRELVMYLQRLLHTAEQEQAKNDT